MSFFGGIKRTPADAAFSEYVREIAGWKCQWPGCFKNFSSNHQGLHCSHLHTRGNPRVRFDLGNVAALCAYHHDYAGKHPVEHVEFFRRRLGNVAFEEMNLRANTQRKSRLDHKFEAIKWRAALKDLGKSRPVIIGSKA